MRIHRRLRAASLKKRDKYILALNRERKRLRMAQWHAPLIKLEQPRQQGWLRTFVFRDDILRRKDADTLVRILQSINVCQYSRRMDFTQRDEFKRWLPMGIHPSVLDQNQWNRLGLPQSCRKYFIVKYQCDYRGVWHPEYHFKDEWMLVTKICPRMITHQRVLLPEVERRLAEIAKIFEENDFEARLHTLEGRRNQSWYQRRYGDVNKRKLPNQTTGELVEEFWLEEFDNQ